MSKNFDFQQFKIVQSRAAFKVGTDSIVLGGWLQLQEPSSILDIGAGTGVLSLIMAQKFPSAKIVALEIDKGSVSDCYQNFEKSEWSTRLSLHETDAQTWAKTDQSLFELIISNPPYFENDLKPQNERKKVARHVSGIGPRIFTKIAERSPHKVCSIAIILPARVFERWEKQFKQQGFFVQKACYISSYSGEEHIRVAAIFNQNLKAPKIEHQFLYDKPGERSKWYRSITKEYYLY